MLRRSGIAIVGCVLTLVSSVAFAAPKPVGPVCSVEGQIRDRGRGWTTIQAPEWPASDTSDRPLHPGGYIVAIGVDPTDPNVLFVTNGSRVFRSKDSGCNWEQVFEMPQVPSGTPPREKSQMIRQIVVTKSTRKIYLVQSNFTQLIHAHIFVSSDGGDTWALSNQGLPPASAHYNSDVPVLVPFPGDESKLYYYLQTGPLVPNKQLYFSDDAGATWTFVSDVAAELQREVDNHTVRIPLELAVDPVDVNSVWAWDNTEVIHSTDGGATWAKIIDIAAAAGPNNIGGAVSDGATALDVYHEPGKPARIVASTAANCRVNSPEWCIFRSDDDGKTWIATDGPGTSQALGLRSTSTDGIIYLSTDALASNVFRYDARLALRGRDPWVDITGPIGSAASPLRGLTVIPDGKKTLAFFFQEQNVNNPNNTIERYRGKV
jgi:photosystem II stability/assembly factor-like uncharacterized protein